MAYDRIFLDSDILIDVILLRPPHHVASSQVLNLIEQSELVFCTTVHTLLNVHYIVKKHIGKDYANKSIRLLLEKIQIITEDEKLVKQALNSAFIDFEDAVQYYAAERINADAIITRNIKDYKLSKIPVYTAEQFLRIIL